MKIYLIRHGQTDWNLAGKIQGKTDIPLNDTGVAQARFLADAMKLRPVAQVFTSPLKRAFETAEVTALTLNVPLIAVPQFAEVDFGLWEGLTWKEVGARFPEDFAGWLESPVEHSPTGGETRSQAEARTREGLRFLLEHAEGDAALVAHGAILAYIRDALFENQEKPKETIVGNASISTVEYDPEKKTAKILETNVTSYLID